MATRENYTASRLLTQRVRALEELDALREQLWDVYQEREQAERGYRQGGDPLMAFKNASEMSGIQQAQRLVNAAIRRIEALTLEELRAMTPEELLRGCSDA